MLKYNHLFKKTPTMPTKFLLVLLLAVSAFGIAIEDDPAFKKIYQLDQNSGKLVLMIYSAQSCPQCAYMKEKVFKEQHVQVFLKKHFVVLEKDVHKDDLPSGFDYFGIPTIFFVDREGRSRGKFVGSSRAAPFLQELKQVVQKAENP